MTLIQKFNLAWRFTRDQRWSSGVKWSETDALALHAFLSSATGKKLSMILQNAVIEQNAAAVGADTNDLAKACGYANGQAGMVRVIEMMSDPASFSDTESDSPPYTDN